MTCSPQRVTLDRLIQGHVPTARSLRPIIVARSSNPRPIIAARSSEAKPIIAARSSEAKPIIAARSSISDMYNLSLQLGGPPKTYHCSSEVHQNLSLQPGGPLKIYHCSPAVGSKSPKPVIAARRSEAKPVILDRRSMHKIKR